MVKKKKKVYLIHIIVKLKQKIDHMKTIIVCITGFRIIVFMMFKLKVLLMTSSH